MLQLDSQAVHSSKSIAFLESYIKEYSNQQQQDTYSESFSMLEEDFKDLNLKRHNSDMLCDNFSTPPKNSKIHDKCTSDLNEQQFIYEILNKFNANYLQSRNLELLVIDARYNYEHEGGRIHTALNINTASAILRLLKNYKPYMFRKSFLRGLKKLSGQVIDKYLIDAYVKYFKSHEVVIEAPCFEESDNMLIEGNENKMQRNSDNISKTQQTFYEKNPVFNKVKTSCVVNELFSKQIESKKNTAGRSSKNMGSLKPITKKNSMFVQSTKIEDSNKNCSQNNMQRPTFNSFSLINPFSNFSNSTAFEELHIDNNSEINSDPVIIFII